MSEVKKYLQVTRRTAFAFIFLLGLVSLLSDMTYEGARSITGPYLQILGASATAVGIIAGLGEFIGYAFRLVTGYISDKTRQYWPIMIIGYSINIVAVPLLALAGNWEIAAMLILLERFGKALRSPAKDAILSYATSVVGRGWGFGIAEALDQLGALTGPLILAGILWYKGSYQAGFAILLIPAMLSVAILLVARFLFPNPGDFEREPPKLETGGFSKTYWIYLLAVMLIAAAFADFPLISFHFQKHAIVAPEWIPVLYGIAMGVDALAALIFGRLFDRLGIPVLAGAALLSAFFAPLVFFGDFNMILIGMVLWGVGMGAQESIMKAAIANLAPTDKRGTAFGIFNTGFGIFWFLGSAIMGILYDVSVLYLVIFSMLLQLLAIPLFLWVRK